MSVQNPFQPHARKSPECQAAIRDLENDHGDPFTLLGAYRCVRLLFASTSVVSLTHVFPLLGFNNVDCIGVIAKKKMDF